MATDPIIGTAGAPVPTSSVESFLSLPPGTLNALIPLFPTQGSAIRRTFSVNAGDTLTFRWNFLTNEATPNIFFDDFSFVTIVMGQAILLADTFFPTFVNSGTLFLEETGYNTFSFQFPVGGTVTLGFGVMDSFDNIFTSGLIVDSVALCGTDAPPPVNTPPTVTCPVASDFQCVGSPPQATVSLTVQVDDADGDGLIVTWLVDNALVQTDVLAAGSGLPASVSFNNAVFDLGAHPVEVIVDDGTETDSCTTVVTVVDTIPPVALCQADVTVDTDPGVCLASGVGLTAPQVSENCQVDSLTNDAPGVFLPGSTTVTWTVTDVGGNLATCTQLVTVVDVEPPVGVCASGVTAPTDEGECSATVILDEPAVSDNCGIASVTNNAPASFPLGTTTVTWTVTDTAGNSILCPQGVAVGDFEAPVAVCAPGVTAPTDEGECSATVILEEPAASDNCGIASVTNDAPESFPLGATTVTWTVTDDAGNETTCTQDVTVVDVESPVVSCSVDDEMLDDGLWPPNHKLEAVGLNVAVSDNCDEAPVITVLVFGDEDDEEPTGDGMHSPDAKDIAAGTLRLRKERKGDADGRVYLILVLATDAAGNVGFDCCTVTVPHSQSPSDRAAVQDQAAAAEAECLANGFAPASFVLVGDGPVNGPHQ